jgi:hypothetical protein
MTKMVSGEWLVVSGGGFSQDLSKNRENLTTKPAGTVVSGSTTNNQQPTTNNYQLSTNNQYRLAVEQDLIN